MVLVPEWGNQRLYCPGLVVKVSYLMPSVRGLDADVHDILISIGDDEQLGHAIQTHIIDTLSNDEQEKVSIVRDSIERCGPLGGLYSTSGGWT